MAVSSTLNRISYTGGGGVTSFPYPFLIFANTDLEVYVDGVLKTLTTHYTVTGVGSPTGGNVNMVTAPDGLTLIILRNLPETQASELPANDKFPSTTIETALDKLTMLVQELQEVDTRSLKLPITSLFNNLSVPDPVAGKFLRWNALLTAVENADITTIGSLGIPVALADGGTGGTTSLTARQNLLVDGQVSKNLTNKTGISNALNDVVAIDTANDSAVKLGDTSGGLFKYVVAAATIVDNAVGRYVTSGIVVVKSTGAIARGQYVRKSATTLAVEDAVVAMSATGVPPAGVIGIALNAAAGNVVTIFLFDQTYAAAGSGGVNPIAVQVFGG